MGPTQLISNLNKRRNVMKISLRTVSLNSEKLLQTKKLQSVTLQLKLLEVDQKIAKPFTNLNVLLDMNNMMLMKMKLNVRPSLKRSVWMKLKVIQLKKNVPSGLFKNVKPTGPKQRNSAL